MINCKYSQSFVSKILSQNYKDDFERYTLKNHNFETDTARVLGNALAVSLFILNLQLNAVPIHLI